MTVHASSHMSVETDSAKAAVAIARQLRDAFVANPLKAVIAYATVTHDQATLLRTLRSELGPDVLLLGCSVQGAMTTGAVREGGFLVGAMGPDGESLQIQAAVERDIDQDTRSKGRNLASHLLSQLGEQPKVCIVLYDPLCNADVEQMLAGITESLQCPIVGGGAGQPFGPIVKTFQYWQDQVIEHAAIAIGLSGPFLRRLACVMAHRPPAS